MGVTCSGTQRNRTFNSGQTDTGLKSLAFFHDCAAVLLCVLMNVYNNIHDNKNIRGGHQIDCSDYFAIAQITLLL